MIGSLCRRLLLRQRRRWRAVARSSITLDEQHHIYGLLPFRRTTAVVSQVSPEISESPDFTIHGQWRIIKPDRRHFFLLCPSSSYYFESRSPDGDWEQRLGGGGGASCWRRCVSWSFLISLPATWVATEAATGLEWPAWRKRERDDESVCTWLEWRS